MTTAIKQSTTIKQPVATVSHRRKRAQIVLLVLGLLLIVAILAGVGIGAVRIAPTCN